MLQDYEIPVMVTVAATSREQAARVIRDELTAADVGKNPDWGRPAVAGWWFPEIDLQHVDGNDNTPHVLVSLEALADKADKARRVADWIRAEPERQRALLERFAAELDETEPVVEFRSGPFGLAPRIIVH